jgi:hypothetical protein
MAVLVSEAQIPPGEQDYKRRARPALTMLWVLAKMLYGDLSTMPLPKDINAIDFKSTVDISDGTLAAIPFPTRESITVFGDSEGNGMTMKARTYLSAVAAATFYQKKSPLGKPDRG